MSISGEKFNLYWTKAMPEVSAFINAMVPDFHQAQDIVQEVAVVLYEKLETYDESRSFTAWAIGIAKNKVLESRRRRVSRPMIYDTEIIERVAGICADLAPQLAERMYALDNCTKKLSLIGRMQKVFLLRYQSGLPPRMIAGRTGINVSNVRSMLCRIRDDLRKCIKDTLKKQEAV